MTTPGISLIIPAYNASLYLREAIDSALNQTLRPRQIIVVDDGSTDDTAGIARSYGAVLGAALIVISQANAGSSMARNRGLAEADQPLIAFLDADDRYAPDKLQRQARTLSTSSNASFCLCKACDFWSPEMVPDTRHTAALLPQFRPGQVGTWLVRREVFDRVGTFSTSPDFKYSEGSELYTRIEGAGLGIVRMEEALVDRRLHASNKTNNSKAHLDGIMALMQRRLAPAEEIRVSREPGISLIIQVYNARHYLREASDGIMTLMMRRTRLQRSLP